MAKLNADLRPPSSLDEADRQLRELISTLEREHQDRMRPYYQQLTRIEMMRPRCYLMSDIEWLREQLREQLPGK